MRIRSRILVPFNFAIEPRTPITFTKFKEKVILVCQNYEGVKVYSYLNNNYKDLQDPGNGRSFLKLCQRFTDRDEALYRQIVCNDKSENFLEGNIDLLKSTGFDIYFDYPDNEFELSEKCYERIKLKAIELLSHFIHTYRMFSNEVDIQNPSILEFPIMDLHYSNKKLDSEDEIINGGYSFLGRLINVVDNELTGNFKATLSEETLRGMTNFLNSSEPIPIHIKLLKDAKEFSRIHKDSNVSIIISVSATEVFLQTKFIEECERQGIKFLPTKKRKENLMSRILSKEKSKKIKFDDYLNAIIKGNVRDDLLGIIGTYLTGVKIKSSKEYCDWYHFAYKMRNDIIHQGKYERNEEDAKNAYESVVRLMSYIEGLLKQKHSTSKSH